MEITAQLDEPTKLAIIPTVVLPFTIIGMILTSVATWIAAFFGVELKAEGPKRLFEVLIKPKVLLLALLSNLVVYGVIKVGRYIYEGPYPMWWVKAQNVSPVSSDRDYADSHPHFGVHPVPASQGSLSEVWQLPLGGAVFGSPLVSGDSLFAGLDKGRLLEIDLKTGKRLRLFEIGKPVMTSPLIWNQKVFVGEGIHLTHHARMYSFDLKSGSFTGAFQSTGHIERAGVIASSRGQTLLIFPAGKEGLHAMDPQTMKEVWQAPIGHIDSSPVLDGERVFVGTGLEEGYEVTPTKVYSLDVHTGKTLWQKSLPTSSWGVPVIWEKIVCFPTGDVYKNTDYGQLTCYEKETGLEYFSFNTTGALISQPTVKGELLTISDLHGKVYQFDLKNRRLNWTLQVPTKGLSYSSVVLDDQDRVYLPGAEGLYIYSQTTQNLLSLWKPQKGDWAGTFTNVVPYKDLWLLTDRKGILRALRFQ